MSTTDIPEGGDKAANKPPVKGASAPKVMTAVKFDIERFDGKKTDFAMWQCQMSDILCPTGFAQSIVGE